MKLLERKNRRLAVIVSGIAAMVIVGILISVYGSRPTDTTSGAAKKTSEDMATSQPSPSPAPGFTVKGNKVYDSAGKPHIFHGLNRPSLEWSSQGDKLSLADYTLMSSWKANVIRLPLNQKYWIQDTDNYQATVRQQVDWINSLGMDVILDLHWSVGGDMANKADQYNMADTHSRTFWKQVATAYKDNPRVLFELYNEPRDMSWQVWRNGGQTADVTTEPHVTFQAVGMQQLYDDVRSTGAQNVIIIGGLNWAFDLSGIAQHAITGTNIMYATHPYDYFGKNTAADWDKSFGKLSETHPVIMSEFGTLDCSTKLYDEVLDYAKARGISWTAWAWFAGDCKFPALITGWDGTPSTSGAIVKAAM